MTLLQTTCARIAPLDAAAQVAAKSRLDQLTMPHWALGRLMDLALELAGITGSARPPVARKTVVVMAGDHGVTAEGVSLYPSEVTLQMVLNFVAGGAGINALARQVGAAVQVVDMGVRGDTTALAAAGKIRRVHIADGTKNMAAGAAMTREEAERAVEAGIEIALALGATTDVFGTGDMGIGNTTPSSAIVSVLTGEPVPAVTGKGTGIDDAQLKAKVGVIEKAIALNRPNAVDALDVLAKLGGFEIAGIAGVILGAASQRKPVIIDGFISTAGALIAQGLCAGSANYMIAAHRSVERGHQVALAKLGKKPLMDLDLRLGEGTGAALAMHLVEAAVRVLTEVATFGEAGVSSKE
jgi:nicotinate-nucleotide--dimethylbenzimidazole phosphoribosyltransferase